MKILVVGGGAREHAIAWKLARERGVTAVICAPGNPGIAAHARCVPADIATPRAVLDVAQREAVDLTVVGPELPLSVGVVDLFAAEGRPIVGPTQGRRGARMEQGVREGLHGAASRADGALPRLRFRERGARRHRLRRVRLPGGVEGRRPRRGQGGRHRRGPRHRRRHRPRRDDRSPVRRGGRARRARGIPRRRRGVVLRAGRRRGVRPALVRTGSQTDLRSRPRTEYRRHGRVRAEPAA